MPSPSTSFADLTADMDWSSDSTLDADEAHCNDNPLSIANLITSDENSPPVSARQHREADTIQVYPQSQESAQYFPEVTQQSYAQPNTNAHIHMLGPRTATSLGPSFQMPLNSIHDNAPSQAAPTLPRITLAQLFAAPQYPGYETTTAPSDMPGLPVGPIHADNDVPLISPHIYPQERSPNQMLNFLYPTFDDDTSGHKTRSSEISDLLAYIHRDNLVEVLTKAAARDRSVYDMLQMVHKMETRRHQRASDAISLSFHAALARVRHIIEKSVLDENRNLYYAPGVPWSSHNAVGLIRNEIETTIVEQVRPTSAYSTKLNALMTLTWIDHEITHRAVVENILDGVREELVGTIDQARDWIYQVAISAGSPARNPSIEVAQMKLWVDEWTRSLKGSERASSG